jgi:proteic killer suppression protein
VIKDFADTATEDFYNGLPSKAARRIPQNLSRVAHRKLDMLNAAQNLMDLSAPPANRLEALKGDRKGFYSIRINEQYRVVFKWVEGHAYHVQIVDYH